MQKRANSKRQVVLMQNGRKSRLVRPLALHNPGSRACRLEGERPREPIKTPDTKSGITIRNCVLSYQDKQIPLLAGEALARRTMQEHWPAILSRVKEMGLEVVSTIIEWN